MNRVESMIEIKLFIENLVQRDIQRRVETEKQLSEIISKYRETKMTIFDMLEIKECDLVPDNEIWLVLKDKRIAKITNIGTEKMNRVKLAKEILKRYKLKHENAARYRGVSVSEFDREELLKIIDMYVGLLDIKDRTIGALTIKRGY